MYLRYIIYLALFLGAVCIQGPLWWGRGGYFKMVELENELNSIRAANERLRNENDANAAEVESLESGSGAVEERARMRLGMIRNDEVLFRFVPKEQKKAVRADELDPAPKGKVKLFEPHRSDLYVPGELPKKKDGKS